MIETASPVSPFAWMELGLVTAPDLAICPSQPRRPSVTIEQNPPLPTARIFRNTSIVHLSFLMTRFFVVLANNQTPLCTSATTAPLQQKTPLVYRSFNSHVRHRPKTFIECQWLHKQMWLSNLNGQCSLLRHRMRLYLCIIFTAFHVNASVNVCHLTEMTFLKTARIRLQHTQ